jgi:hypothetical protein
VNTVMNLMIPYNAGKFSSIPAQLVASQEGLSSMKLVSYIKCFGQGSVFVCSGASWSIWKEFL